MNIRVTAGVVTISEADLRQVLSAVDEAKENIEFADEPVSDSDMSASQRIREETGRGKITVASLYSDMVFKVCVDQTPASQESCGFKWMSGA